jgi:hypothetical protein
VESTADLLAFRTSPVRHQSVQHAVALTARPLPPHFPRQRRIVYVGVLEDPLDGAGGEISVDPLRPELGAQSGRTLRAMPQPVAHERFGDGSVVEEAFLIQAVEARVDASGAEALLPEPAVQLDAGPGAIGEEIECGVADADVGVVVEEVMPFFRRESVSDAETVPFQRLQHDLERLSPVEVQENLQASGPQGLNPCDERVGRHGGRATRSGTGGGRGTIRGIGSARYGGTGHPRCTYQLPSVRSWYSVITLPSSSTIVRYSLEMD